MHAGWNQHVDRPKIVRSSRFSLKEDRSQGQVQISLKVLLPGSGVVIRNTLLYAYVGQRST